MPILWIKSGIFISAIWPAFVAAATLEAAELANPAASAADSVENIDARLVSVVKRKLPGETTVMKLDRVPEWLQTLTQRIVRDNIPHKYVRDKDWGKTAERWDGIQIRRKGPLRLTTKRKWKEVKHGTWKRYEIRQIDPLRNLTMRISNVDTVGRSVRFNAELTSKLHVHGRQAQWAKGIQLYNVSANALADVHLNLQCTLGVRMDASKLPPDVIVVPHVEHAKLDVVNFELQSVSKLKGPIVSQLSGTVHDVLLDRIAEKQRELPTKMNRSIEKHAADLRFSISDFAVQSWRNFVSSPAPSQ